MRKYIYDAENRLRAVDWGTSNGYAYAYDHLNRRIKRAEAATGTWKHHVWEGSRVIAEYDHTGALEVEYVYAGGRMIAREQGTSRVYFLYDRLSVRATITDGGRGNIQGRQGHLLFGEEIGGSGTTNKHMFTSYEQDSESGVDYAVNRSHSSSVGRFMQADPYRGSNILCDPQSLN